MPPTFNDLITCYQQCSDKAPGTTRSYISYVQRIYKGIPSIPNDLANIINNPNNAQSLYSQLLQNVRNYLASALNTGAIKSSKTANNLYSGFKHFCDTILGIFNARVFISSIVKEELLCRIVASSVIFASFDVVVNVINGKNGTRTNKKAGGNPFASWDNMASARINNLPKGQKVSPYVYAGITYPSIIADDNTRANLAIKKAVILSLQSSLKLKLKLKTKNLIGYEACHIWDVPQDPRYYTSIMNLVLVPRAFGQLTDHCQAVQDMLRNRANDLFWSKPGLPTPLPLPLPPKPKFYDSIVWRKLPW